MKIPLAYNYRNLIERKATTLMTAMGIALAVCVLVTATSLMTGLKSVFSSTGKPTQVVALRKGGSAELNSVILEPAYQLMRQSPLVAHDESGEALASPEMVTIINLPSVDSPAGMNVTVRGLRPVGVSMRRLDVQLGRWFRPGRRELVVGQSIARRYHGARYGSIIRFGRGYWKVVGLFSGGESVVNSEIWCDLDQLRADFDRQANMSSVLLRARSTAEVDALIDAIKNDRQLNATAMREQAYYASMTTSGTPLQILGTSVAVIMAIGSAFGAMNTMYAAVARRGREIGTLRSLGFSRGSILFSFMLESILLSLVGGALGILMALPLNGLSTGIGNFQTFSEIAFNFRIGPGAMMIGLVFAVSIGALGGFLPAQAAARRDLLRSLRDV